MSESQVKNLTKLYNTLLLITTRGEDTLIMAECLKALQKTIEEGALEAGLTVKEQPQNNTEAEE